MTSSSKPKIVKVSFQELKQLPIEQVYVSPQNTRQTEREVGLSGIEGRVDAQLSVIARFLDLADT